MSVEAGSNPVDVVFGGEASSGLWCDVLTREVEGESTMGAELGAGGCGVAGGGCVTDVELGGGGVEGGSCGKEVMSGGGGNADEGSRAKSGSDDCVVGVTTCGMGTGLGGC